MFVYIYVCIFFPYIVSKIKLMNLNLNPRKDYTCNVTRVFERRKRCSLCLAQTPYFPTNIESKNIQLQRTILAAESIDIMWQLCCETD